MTDRGEGGSGTDRAADADPAIAAIGAYAPRLRIDAAELREGQGEARLPGIDRKAVPEADEDAVTMAAEALDRALEAAGRDGAAVRHLALATTTPPLAEEDLTARLASVVGAPEDAATTTVTGSTRAGAQALVGALNAGPWGDGVGAVVAADAPRGAPADGIEHAAGAGAAAFVLDGSGPGRVVDRGSHVEPYPGTRFREAGSTETTGLGVTAYDREAFRTALGGAVGRIDAGDVDAAAVQSPDGKLPYRVAGALGVDAGTIAAGSTVEDLGDTGAASALLGTARAVADGADRVLLAAYGSGAGANALAIDVDGDLPVAAALAGDVDLTYAEYLRRRGLTGADEPAGGGAYVSVPSWRRTIPQRHRLVAGACPACGGLNFPPEGACRDCGERVAYEAVTLPGTGRVEATTTIAPGGAPPEFVEQASRSGPFVSAVLALDGPDGDRTVSVPAQVLTGPESDAEVGDPVETTVRRIYEQEGVVRYGFKARLEAIRR